MFASNQLVTDFHAAQSVRALTYERAIQRMADQQPEELAKLLRANPRMLNTLADPEAIAKALAEEGQTDCVMTSHIQLKSLVMFASHSNIAAQLMLCDFEIALTHKT